jgi:hypothetical protein
MNAMAKATYEKKQILFARKLDLSSKKKLVKCYNLDIILGNFGS